MRQTTAAATLFSQSREEFCLASLPSRRRPAFALAVLGHHPRTSGIARREAAFAEGGVEGGGGRNGSQRCQCRVMLDLTGTCFFSDRALRCNAITHREIVDTSRKIVDNNSEPSVDCGCSPRRVRGVAWLREEGRKEGRKAHGKASASPCF